MTEQKIREQSEPKIQSVAQIEGSNRQNKPQSDAFEEHPKQY